MRTWLAERLADGDDEDAVPPELSDLVHQALNRVAGRLPYPVVAAIDLDTGPAAELLGLPACAATARPWPAARPGRS